MEMRRTNSRRKKFRDKLPGHLGKAILKDLTLMVDELSATEGFKAGYLKEQYLSKYCDPTTTSPEHRREAAIKKWLSQEERNARTNIRLYMAEPDMVIAGCRLEDLLSKAGDIVERVLGPLRYPNILWDSVHTNGASTRVPREVTSAMDKLTGAAHISSSALKHWTLGSYDTILEGQELEMRESSQLFTVPKSTDIDRVACKEPEINMFLQRSVGNHIRRRLRKYGIDLNDQTRNQELAKIAVKRDLATIDLSSASDSITTQLVFSLLPLDWFHLMNDLRVKATIIVDGDVETHHELEMFSSMGNGFTFELESLLFYAITRAISWELGIKGTISVFGDDIIAPCALVGPLMQVFHFFGFKTNEKKTFWTGKFRESCGCHYWNGVDVSPFYVKGPIVKVTELIKLLNQLLQWDAYGYGFFQTQQCAEFHRKYSRHVPKILYGGQNIEEIGSLVTGDLPRQRLVPKKKDVQVDASLALKHWLVVRRFTRTSDEIEPYMEHLDWCKTPQWHEASIGPRGPKASLPLSGHLYTPYATDAAEEVGYELVPQPEWLVRTDWQPYFVW